ncbi:unnamed protein product [Trichobilharzia szidati]|nr:unnamed protein product [Trichobilharzia szidati]
MNALAAGDNGNQPALPISVDIKKLFDGIMLSHRYTSWVQVEDALSQLESATHTHYVIKKCIRNHESEELKYKLVVFRCTYGMKRKSRGLGLRVKPAKYTGCQSGFRIRYKENEFIICSARTVHNHKCEQSRMIGDPYFRRLSGDEKENIAPVVKTASEVGDVLEYAEENFSKILTTESCDLIQSTDVYNLRKDVRPDVMRIIRQSGQVVEYVESNTGITSRICFALESQVQLYRKYGEVVCIDSTYNTNKDGNSLFQLVVTDNMGHGRPVLLAWTRRERSCDIAWILEHFQRIMQNTSITETFIMDSANCDISAVRNSRIQAKIVICAFHVCRAFSRKTRNPFVRRFLYRLVKAATPESVIRTVDRRWIIPIQLVPAEFLGHKEYLAGICYCVTFEFLSLQLTK